MTPADVLALLRANPEAARAAVDAFRATHRVAGPWECSLGEPGRGTDQWFRLQTWPVETPNEHPMVAVAQYADDYMVGRLSGVTRPGWWLLDETPEVFESAEAAKAAVDEKLRASGWTLEEGT